MEGQVLQMPGLANATLAILAVAVFYLDTSRLALF